MLKVIKSDKQRTWYDVDVLTEAKKRIKHLFETNDKVVVSFSGGKDSLVCLHLVEEVKNEMGIKGPLEVLFRDEELIPDDVINFVIEYAKMTDRFNMRYIAVPQLNYYFVLGELKPYIQWDPKRKDNWVRPLPNVPNLITSLGEQYDKNPVTQHNMNTAMFAGQKGRIALVNGIRAAESLVRYRSCLAKKNENYINGCDAKNVKWCKPIFDWSEDDIFKYFYDRKIKYCSIYDMQMFAKQTFRVATPVHKNAYQELCKLREMYPIFYQQIISIWPEIDTQARYWKDVDEYYEIAQYPKTWDGIIQYANDNIDDQAMRDKAIEQILLCRDTRRRNMGRRMRESDKRIIDDRNFWGYPMLHVWKQIISGNYSRGIQAKSLDQINKADRDYEADAPEWVEYLRKKNAVTD